MPKINSLEVVHQDTNKDSYDNLHDILVALKDAVGLSKEDGNYLINKEIIDGKARAAYEVLLEMYVNDKEAFAKKLETLTAEFGTSIAKVLEEWTVYASATEAYAKKIEEVSAKAFQNEAKVTEEMYARVTADEAVAKLVTTLRADFENAQTRSKASIIEEQIARANADEALASRSFVMEASIEDANARITQEQLVRATADEAIALNIESLTATVEDNTASILTEQIARANADEALATQINTVSATASGKNRTYVQTTAPTGTTLVPLVAGDLWFDSDDNNKLYRYSGSSWVAVDDSRIGITAAAVSVETTARVTADEALASQITTVIANVNSNTAAITNEVTARATADEALASQITTLTATVNSNTAAITNEATTRANADSALASQITTLTATVGSKNRTYYQSTAPSSGMVSGDLWIDSDDDKLYRYNGSSWVNIQDNEIAANTAAISNEATARATADSANATAINAVTARLDTGDFAAVKTESSATASKVSGIEARWGVTTNVNGYVAGIQLLNGGSTQSSFTVDATKFIVKKPDGTNGIVWNGAASRLDVSGDIYANNFYGTGVVGTTNITNNAVSNASSANVVGYPSNLNLSITTAGGKTFVSGAFFVGGVTGPASALIQLYRGGSLLATFEAYVPDGASAANVSVAYSETPPTGGNTYTFVKNGTYMDGAAYVVELKR